MSDAHEERGSGWQPIPQSEGYDGDATAFVQLPPDFMLEGVPLEAPGHGYVPPVIAPLPPAPPAPPEDYPQEPTVSWTIPTIEDGSDVLDDSGEYTTSTLAPYANGAPATLPGGAAAPWAVEAAGVAEAPAVAEAAGVAEAAVLAEVAEVLEIPEVHGQVEAAGVPEPAEVLEAPATPEATPAEAPEAPVVAVPAEPPTDMSTDSDEHPHTSYTLRVNGADRPVTDSWIGESLLYVLRERLGLAGAKDGCSQGECGACNVQVDGRLVASCLVPAATAAGSEVRTVEGLAVDGEPSDVQRALAKCGVQCGFCIPGMAMTVHDLLEGNHAPNELETRQALCGNLCRCSGYRGVLDAVREVVSGREAAAEAEAEAGEGAARIPHQIPHPFDGGTA
ncbi:(2Fe-2S)-binding protein [Streptomyces sp. NPDC048659]|uniref:(2Fe-2S)-binding protein n=1 Tax=Streptomyces sp. NPDC048659 TaxID=3155489 RepID=UPI00343952BD